MNSSTSTDEDVSVAHAVAMVRKGTWTRIVFTALMATVATAVLPFTVTAAWFAFMAVWEFAFRPFLEDRLALAARSRAGGDAWLAAINLVGGCAYTVFPVLAWMSGAPLGMVMATAWICGSANHLFVYFFSHRALLISCLSPLVACALIAPFATHGFTWLSIAAVLTLVSLIVAAGVFGNDRKLLLRVLSRQSAARMAAEEANAAKSQFLTTMSHELRTPLNSVIGYAELIEEDARDADVREDAGKIRASARQLLGVIDVILDLSKLETGAIELQPERIQIAAILGQLRAAAAPLASANNNVLHIEEAHPLGEADLDHLRLHQCLMQLVSNAAKFTRDGEIRVTATREDARLSFRVADTGIGIMEQDQTRIFEPFTQVEADAARRYEGAGLGLSLVRRLARLMGGDVACESTPGRGSTFTLWIAAPA